MITLESTLGSYTDSLWPLKRRFFAIYIEGLSLESFVSFLNAHPSSDNFKSIF